MGDAEHDEFLIRGLEHSDLDRLVRIDALLSGRNRTTWYKERLARALNDASVRVSLGAEQDGHLVGALMGSVHYGEFGLPEPVAVLDTILVDPAYQHHGVATSIFDQLVKNLRGLRIERLRTEVGWNEQALVGFLGRSGFVPVPRLVLERRLDT